jgi:hypothetical protein
VHMVLIGIPIALFTRRAHQPASLDAVRQAALAGSGR